MEPVVPVTERLDAVLPSQIRLRLPRLGHSKIVETQISRELGLVVTGKERSRRRDVGPLGEPPSPPGIVFRDGMELGQIERHNPHRAVWHV